MFNRTLVIGGGHSSHTHHYNVDEERAPTDESVRLLREMEKAARDEVVKSIRLNVNGFDCVVRTFYDAPTDDTIIRVLFSLNGQKMEAEYIHDRYGDVKKLGEGVLKAVSDRIAESALHELSKLIDKQGFVRTF
jgi:hypothetical protein